MKIFIGSNVRKGCSLSVSMTAGFSSTLSLTALLVLSPVSSTSTIIQPTYQPHPTLSVPSPLCSVMPLHLAHSSFCIQCPFLSAVPGKLPHTIPGAVQMSPVPLFLRNPKSMHPLKHIALCQVCLSSVRPAVLNRR